MTPDSKMTDEKLVQHLKNIDDGLTDWEVEFVESIARRVEDDKDSLTPRQREIAERIYNEKGL